MYHDRKQEECNDTDSWSELESDSEIGVVWVCMLMAHHGRCCLSGVVCVSIVVVVAISRVDGSR